MFTKNILNCAKHVIRLLTFIHHSPIIIMYRMPLSRSHSSPHSLTLSLSISVCLSLLFNPSVIFIFSFLFFLFYLNIIHRERERDLAISYTPFHSSSYIPFPCFVFFKEIILLKTLQANIWICRIHPILTVYVCVYYMMCMQSVYMCIFMNIHVKHV